MDRVLDNITSGLTRYSAQELRIETKVLRILAKFKVLRFRSSITNQLPELLCYLNL
jgi:hypothetical protein